MQKAAMDMQRRLNRPIDLAQTAMDTGETISDVAELDANSLIPTGRDLIEELYGALFEPSLADRAMQAEYRRNIQDQIREPVKQGAPISAPMISSVMQLDR